MTDIKEVFTKQERKALIMHEIMKREQEIYQIRIREQEKLKGVPLKRLREMLDE